MKSVLTDGRIPAKVWADDVEDGALRQIANLSNLPFAFRHVAVMPDCHQGYGMPIGGVLATKGVVIPNAVGVDIGCGMCAVRTSLTSMDVDSLKAVLGFIREVIPVGFGHHKERQDERWMPEYDVQMDIVGKEYQSALHQLGTLGGGNHFIEIQRDSEGFIWVMIHSGSRNIGFRVAKHYNELAISLNEKWHSAVPKQWELAYLPLDSEEGQAYMLEMNYCVDFALANRSLMMWRVRRAISDVFPEAEYGDVVNIAHNYAAMENHFGQNVMIHRKGATRARLGETGIIPGSQGTASYIVTGLGNPDSFMSCSHGAGRRMGRKQAQRELDLSEEQRRLDERGILHSIRGAKDLDEAAGAYKDIETVMANQSDLVSVLFELGPLAVVKG